MKRNTNLIVICLVLFCSKMLMGQSPGGVEGALVWMKTVKNAGTFNWLDFGGENSKLLSVPPTLYTSSVPNTAGVSYYNFNPSLYFNKTGAGLSLTNGNLSQATVIGVFAPLSLSTENLLYGVSGRVGENSVVTTDKVNGVAPDVLDYGEKEGEDLIKKTTTPSDVLFSDPQYRARSLKIVSYYQYERPNISVWGEDQNSSLTLGKLGGNDFQGYVPELLVYGRVLDPLERRKAETYLAIKYGITLGDSYISSNDKLIWDLSKTPVYNNRITGIMRDDKSALEQLTSTTSYEEAVNYSDQFDSYEVPATPDKSSSKRLLVIGESPGNSFQKDGHLLWGDDGGALVATSNPSDTDGLAGLTVMSRKWKTHTNLVSTKKDLLVWSTNGLDALGIDTWKNMFVNNKALASVGTGVTQSTLLGANGYLEFQMDPTKKGEVFVGFVKNGGSPLVSNYGVKIDATGKLSLIIGSATPTATSTTITSSQKISLEKKGSVITVVVRDATSGVKATVTPSVITIPPADAAVLFYGYASIKKTDALLDASIVGLKHGGFLDTGTQVELSYGIATSFGATGVNSRTYLIVDRSGTGRFPANNVDYYPTDEQDTGRSKILFNNVFFQDNDVFTFGYRDKIVKLTALTESVPPSCVGGVLQQDGQIKVEIKEGIPVYKYSLSKQNDANFVSLTGNFSTSTKNFTGLSEGTYNLTLEMVGTNFEKNVGATGTAIVSTTESLAKNTDGSLEFVVTNFISNKYIGFISPRSVTDIKLLNYGVQINQNKLYYYNKGVQGSFLTNLQTNDKIKVAKVGNTIVCSLNGVTIGSPQTIATADVNLIYNGCIGLDNSNNGIYNLTQNGFVLSPAKITWGTATGLTTTEGDAITSKISQTIVLTKPNCTPVVIPGPIIKDKLVVAPVPSKVNVDFTIKLDLDNPSEVMVLIFDSAGSLITQLRNPSVQKSHIFTTQIATPGTYIVKALTGEGEFTKTIIITP